ncbi:MAG: nuclear transport factor 2 family protein [Chthoniobacterales bacterium]
MMKAFAAIAFALLFSLAHAEEKPNPILELQKERYTALVNHDLNALDKLLSTDLVYTHASGVRETKAQFLDGISNKDIEYLSIDPLTANFRNYGSWIVVTGSADFKVRVAGEVKSSRLVTTEVYRKENGKWRLLAYQSTAIK